jgi:hypothetical protein
MFVRSPVTQIVDAKIDNLIFLRALYHAFAQWGAADLGK